MTLSATSPAAGNFGRLISSTLLGSILAATGLVAAYLTIATPLVSRLIPDASPGGSHVAIGFGVWSFSLIAGGALLVSGTSRLAAILTTLKRGRVLGGPAARALGSIAGDVVVVADVVPGEGGPIPELVIGAFGVAVIHTLSPSRKGRRESAGAGGWDSRQDGWQAVDDPLAGAMRDSDRVRRWLSEADLDFVVRVYAAMVVRDRTLERSPTCAVITNEQIPAWIASLPRQRTLTTGRRARLLAMARTRPRSSAATRGQGW
jgi:hypothetical protein